MGAEQDLQLWISKTQFISGYLEPTGFEASQILHATSLEEGEFDFCPWLLGEKATYRAPFEDTAGKSACNRLLRSVRATCGSEPAHWFYITEPDSACSVLEWVKPCDYDRLYSWEGWLEPFIETPAAEGGGSWLGLIGEGRRWLLLQRFSPFGEYVISVHEPSEFCCEMARRMEVTT